MMSRLLCTGLMFTLLGCGSALASEPPVVTVPETIPSDLSEDVTEPLNEFFAGVPNDSVVVFPEGAKYRIEGTVTIVGKRNLTVEGNGALLRATTPGEDHDKKTSYTGWKRTRSRAHVRVTESENIVVRNLTVHGAHPNPGKEGDYDYNREAQHGFDLVKVTDCRLENVTVHDVFGDCVYIAKSRGIVVRDSHLTRCGRQGIAVGTGEDVLIENNTIGDSRRGVIDIEPYGKEWTTGNIRIIGNQLGTSRLLLLPMGGSGTVGMIFIADNVNRGHNGTPALMNVGKPGQNRGPLVMIGNRWSIGGSPTTGLRVRHNEGVLIAGNRLTFPAKRKMTAVDTEGSRGMIAGNVFADSVRILKANDTEDLVTTRDNATNPDFDPAPTEWKRVPGGFAVQTKLADGTVLVALVRGGSWPADEEPPAMISGYEQTTEAEFEWFLLSDGRVIESGRRTAKPVEQ